MKTSISVITAFCLVFWVVDTRANDAKNLERTAAKINEHTKTQEQQTEVLTKISDETGVPVATLKAERSRTGLGYGDLFIANSLASATGKTFDEIAALKAGGQGWGKIAKSYQVKLGPIVSQARETDEAVNPPETKSRKKKGDDSDFFNDNEKAAGTGRDSDHGQGSDADKSNSGGNGNANHGSSSQAHGNGHKP
jgi:hypothetical protein